MIFKKEAFSCAYSEEEVLNKVHHILEDDENHDETISFEGSVNLKKHRFQLFKEFYHLPNPFIPIMNGTVSKGDNGQSLIQLRFRIKYTGYLLLAVLFSFILYLLMTSDNLSKDIITTGVFLLILLIVSFRATLNKNKLVTDFKKKLLQNDPLSALIQ